MKMMVVKFAILAGLLILYNSSFCQEVEHNYTVGPQSTDCDSLEIGQLSISEKISRIKATSFRFDQSFKLTRRNGLISGAYYSCDNKLGYLVIVYNEDSLLYYDVEKEHWNQLIGAADPEGYFLDVRNELSRDL